MTIPLKANKTGTTVDALAEYEAGDATPIEHGGTGATTASDARANLGAVEEGGSLQALKLTEYTLATLPDAVAGDNTIIRVTDNTTGTGVCFSDGTSWVDLTTGAAVA